MQPPARWPDSWNAHKVYYVKSRLESAARKPGHRSPAYLLPPPAAHPVAHQTSPYHLHLVTSLPGALRDRILRCPDTPAPGDGKAPVRRRPPARSTGSGSPVSPESLIKYIKTTMYHIDQYAYNRQINVLFTYSSFLIRNPPMLHTVLIIRVFRSDQSGTAVPLPPPLSGRTDPRRRRRCRAPRGRIIGAVQGAPWSAPVDDAD